MGAHLLKGWNQYISYYLLVFIFFLQLLGPIKEGIFFSF